MLPKLTITDHTIASSENRITKSALLVRYIYIFIIFIYSVFCYIFLSLLNIPKFVIYSLVCYIFLSLLYIP